MAKRVVKAKLADIIAKDIEIEERNYPITSEDLLPNIDDLENIPQGLEQQLAKDSERSERRDKKSLENRFKLF